MRLYWTLLKKNLAREWANKANFITFSCVNLFGYLGDLIFYLLLYQYTNDINGWTKFHMLALIASSWIIDSLNGGIFQMNILRIPRYVQTYELDFFLIKPISSRWYASMKFISFGLLSGVPFGCILLVYSLINLKVKISLAAIILYALGIIASTLIIHNLFFIIITCSIKFVKMNALQSLAWSLLDIGKYPASIYPTAISKIFTFIIPVLVIYNFPVDFIVGGNWGHLALLFIISAISTLVTDGLWRFMLKYYYI